MLKCTRRTTWICLITGSIILAIGAISIPVLHLIIRQQIINNVILRNGTQGYEQWVSPTPPIYLQFWTFDLKNPAEVMNGEKPYVVERGPYTYREHRHKVNITFNQNGTVSYRQILSYNFVPEMSVGFDNETFLTVNIPLVTLATAVINAPTIVRDAATFALGFFKEDLFVRKSVKDMVWGYKDEGLAAAKLVDPSWFTEDMVGIRAGKNNTDDGVYTVQTGENDIDFLGVIDKYNGMSSVPYWTTPLANQINGTDGSIGPPFLNRDRVVGMFSSDICRSVIGLYEADDVTPQGINLYRYTGPWRELANATIEPMNKGFCTPPDHCMGSGVLNISTCQIIDRFHIPLVVSFPHFYMADSKYQNDIGNMHPGPQHRTDVCAEPNTGFIMKAYKRLQINIYLQKVDSVFQTGNVATMVYPVAWINESTVIDDVSAAKVQTRLLYPKLIGFIMQIAMIIIGSLMVVVAVLLLCMRRNIPDDAPPSDITRVIDDIPPTETTPLLSGNSPHNGNIQDADDPTPDNVPTAEPTASQSRPSPLSDPLRENKTPSPVASKEKHTPTPSPDPSEELAPKVEAPDTEDPVDNEATPNTQSSPPREDTPPKTTSPTTSLHYVEHSEDTLPAVPVVKITSPTLTSPKTFDDEQSPSGDQNITREKQGPIVDQMPVGEQSKWQ